MAKGHYHGGGTLIGPRGRIGRAPLRGGTECKASAEARRVARKTEKAEQRKRIAKSEHLIRKLAKLWQEERGKAHFRRLTQEAMQDRRTRMTGSQETESSLSQALRAAGLVPDEPTGDA